MRNNKVKKSVFFVMLIIISLAVIIGLMSKMNFISQEKVPIQPIYKSGSSLTFFVATDLHYLANSLTDDGQAFTQYIEKGDGKLLNYITEITDAFVRDIESKKPDILIISGDLTNNGEAESHKELAKKLIKVEKSGTPVYVVPGNHDIQNPWARGFKEEIQYKAGTITAKDFSKIYGSFGYDEAIMRDKSTLSYLAAPSEDVWLLMLDTNRYENNKVLGFPQVDGVISDNTLQWIKKCIALAKENKAELIPVMHHNLLKHSEVIIEGYTLDNSQEVLDLFKQNGIKLTLSGHIHVQDISSSGDIYDIATGSLAVYPQRYGILKYNSSLSSFSYDTTWVGMEEWAEASNSKDDHLRNFKKYSEDFFGKLAYRMAEGNLEKQGGYSTEQRRQMAEVVETLNKRYFAGVENINAEDVINSPGYKLWESAKDGFLKNYVKSISYDKDTADNSLQFQLK